MRATLHIERAFSNSTISQDIHFYADIRRIDFVTTVDWKEHQHLLKVQFPCNVHTDEATFEVQYGNLTRKTHTNTSWDRARFELRPEVGRPVRRPLRRQPAERLQVRPLCQGQLHQPDPDQVRH